jgi:hypothetical protein
MDFPVAMRYRHRVNKADERRMLESRDIRQVVRWCRGYYTPNDSNDIEALLASLLMTPSYLRETRELRKALIV